MSEEDSDEGQFKIMITDDKISREVAEELFERALDLLFFKRERYIELFEKAVKGREISPGDTLEVGFSFTYIGNDVFQILGRIMRRKRGGTVEYG